MTIKQSYILYDVFFELSAHLISQADDGDKIYLMEIIKQMYVVKCRPTDRRLTNSPGLNFAGIEYYIGLPRELNHRVARVSGSRTSAIGYAHLAKGSVKLLWSAAKNSVPYKCLWKSNPSFTSTVNMFLHLALPWL